MGGALCAAATGRLRRACVSHRTAVCVGSVLVLVFVQAAVVNGGQPVGSRQDSGTRWSLVTLSRRTTFAARNLALRPMRGGSDDSDSDSDSDSDKRGQKREDELSRRLNEQSLEPSLFDETPDAEVIDKLKKIETSLNANQRGLATVQTSLEKLLAQEHENKLVLQELKSTPPEFGVYKQTGPVLLAQDHKEARDNVAKRLVFIRSEKKRAQDRIKTLQEQVTRLHKQYELLRRRATVMRQQAQTAAGAAGE